MSIRFSVRTYRFMQSMFYFRIFKMLTSMYFFALLVIGLQLTKAERERTSGYNPPGNGPPSSFYPPGIGPPGGFNPPGAFGPPVNVPPGAFGPPANLPPGTFGPPNGFAPPGSFGPPCGPPVGYGPPGSMTPDFYGPQSGYAPYAGGQKGGNYPPPKGVYPPGGNHKGYFPTRGGHKGYVPPRGGQKGYVPPRDHRQKGGYYPPSGTSFSGYVPNSGVEGEYGFEGEWQRGDNGGSPDAWQRNNYRLQGGFGSPCVPPGGFNGAGKFPWNFGGGPPCIFGMFPGCRDWCEAMNEKLIDLEIRKQIGPEKCRERDIKKCIRKDMERAACELEMDLPSECYEEVNFFMTGTKCNNSTSEEDVRFRFDGEGEEESAVTEKDYDIDYDQNKESSVETPEFVPNDDDSGYDGNTENVSEFPGGVEYNTDYDFERNTKTIESPYDAVSGDYATTTEIPIMV